MGHEVLTAKTIRNRRDKSRLDGFRAAVLEEVSIVTRFVEKSNPEPFNSPSQLYDRVEF